MNEHTKWEKVFENKIENRNRSDLFRKANVYLFNTECWEFKKYIFSCSRLIFTFERFHKKIVICQPKWKKNGWFEKLKNKSIATDFEEKMKSMGKNSFSALLSLAKKMLLTHSANVHANINHLETKSCPSSKNVSKIVFGRVFRISYSGTVLFISNFI